MEVRYENVKEIFRINNSGKLDNLFFEVLKTTKKPEGKIESFVAQYLLDKYEKIIVKETFPFYEPGIPDLLILAGDDEFYVEVKSKIDSIKYNQFNWIRNNPDKKVIVFYVDWDKEEKDKYSRKIIY